MMSITVIIVNWNSGELLAECLRRLKAQTISPAPNRL
jgi:GT2 family glycosyltransferase